MSILSEKRSAIPRNWKPSTRLQEELAILVKMTQDCVAKSASIAQDKEDYRKRYDGLVQKYELTKARYDKVEADIADKQARRERLSRFIRLFKGQENPITDFDSHLWGCLVDYVTLDKRKEMTVVFRGGTDIK